MLVFSKSVLSNSLSGFLKGYSCTTALLNMTDDFRATLDNKENCAAIYQKHSTPCPTAFFFQSWEPMVFPTVPCVSLAHIFVEESNVLRWDLKTHHVSNIFSWLTPNHGKEYIFKKLKEQRLWKNICAPWHRLIKSATCWGTSGLTWEKITPTRTDQKE